ncbi:hypothetical protein Tco_1324514, partial [Tanacetum coccineum]
KDRVSYISVFVMENDNTTDRGGYAIRFEDVTGHSKFFFKTSNQWKGRSGRTGTDSCYRVFTGFNNPSRNPEGQSQELQKTDQVQNISDNQLNGDNESVHQVEREDNRNSDGAKTNSTGSRKFKMS